MSRAQRGYQPRHAEASVLHTVIQEQLGDFLQAAADRADGAGLPEFIAREFREFLTCGARTRVMLSTLHGGSPGHDPNLTRHSYVPFDAQEADHSSHSSRAHFDRCRVGRAGRRSKAGQGEICAGHWSGVAGILGSDRLAEPAGVAQQRLCG